MDQWEDAADYILLLSSLEYRRTNLIFTAVAVPLLLALMQVELVWGRSSKAFTTAALAVLVGVVGWRRVTGRAAFQAAASNQRTRRRGRKKGKYNGDARFRLELARGEMRLYDLGGGQQKVMDCRLIHNAVECGEVVWLSGWSRFSVSLPKRQLVNGTDDDLRAWLKPYVKKWKTVEVPEKWKERYHKITKKG